MRRRSGQTSRSQTWIGVDWSSSPLPTLIIVTKEQARGQVLTALSVDAVVHHQCAAVFLSEYTVSEIQLVEATWSF